MPLLFLGMKQPCLIYITDLLNLSWGGHVLQLELSLISVLWHLHRQCIISVALEQTSWLTLSCSSFCFLNLALFLAVQNLTWFFLMTDSVGIGKCLLQGHCHLNTSLIFLILMCISTNVDSVVFHIYAALMMLWMSKYHEALCRVTNIKMYHINVDHLHKVVLFGISDSENSLILRLYKLI